MTHDPRHDEGGKGCGHDRCQGADASQGEAGHVEGDEAEAVVMFSPRPGMLGLLDRGGLLLIRVIVYSYRFTLSPFIGGACRFYPTCSQYMLDAVAKYGPWRGGWRGVMRVLRCNPFCKGGFDPA